MKKKHKEISSPSTQVYDLNGELQFATNIGEFKEPNRVTALRTDGNVLVKDDKTLKVNPLRYDHWLQRSPPTDAFLCRRGRQNTRGTIQKISPLRPLVLMVDSFLRFFIRLSSKSLWLEKVIRQKKSLCSCHQWFHIKTQKLFRDTIYTRMHSSRMCTTCCSGCLSFHACPPCHACPPATHAPLQHKSPSHAPPPCHACPLPHMPPCHICPLATHTPCHTCPHAMHAPSHVCPPAMHAPCHACPPPCIPPTMHAPHTLQHVPPTIHAPYHACHPPCMSSTTHTPSHAHPLWTDRYLWKHYLRKLRLRVVKIWLVLAL